MQLLSIKLYVSKQVEINWYNTIETTAKGRKIKQYLVYEY
jgi:hypothetical protein